MTRRRDTLGRRHRQISKIFSWARKELDLTQVQCRRVAMDPDEHLTPTARRMLQLVKQSPGLTAENLALLDLVEERAKKDDKKNSDPPIEYARTELGKSHILSTPAAVGRAKAPKPPWWPESDDAQQAFSRLHRVLAEVLG